MSVRRGDRILSQVSDPNRVDSDSIISKPVDIKTDTSLSRKLETIEEKNPFLPIRVYNKEDEIPSKGLSYPSGWSISFRSYVFGEIERVAQSNSLVDVFELGLEGIDTQGFDKSQLTLQDFLYLLLSRRILSMGSSKIQVSSICPMCDNTNSAIYETQEFTFDDIRVPKLPIIADLSVRAIKFTPMTIGRWIEMLKASKGEIITKMEYHACQIDLATEDMTYSECFDLIYNLQDQQDIAIVDKVDTMLAHGARMFEFTCSNQVKGEDESLETCGFQYKIKSSSILEAFIYPFRSEEDERVIEDKIRFS